MEAVFEEQIKSARWIGTVGVWPCDWSWHEIGEPTMFTAHRVIERLPATEWSFRAADPEGGRAISACSSSIVPPP